MPKHSTFPSSEVHFNDNQIQIPSRVSRITPIHFRFHPQICLRENKYRFMASKQLISNSKSSWLAFSPLLSRLTSPPKRKATDAGINHYPDCHAKNSHWPRTREKEKHESLAKIHEAASPPHTTTVVPKVVTAATLSPVCHFHRTTDSPFEM